MTANGQKRNRFFPLSRKRRRRLTIAALVISDFLSLGAAFLLAYILRFELLPYLSTYSLRQYSTLVGMMLPFWILIFAAFQLYDFDILFGGLQEYSRVFTAVTICVISLIGLAFFRREDVVISRSWVGISWLFSFLLVSISRFVFRRLVYLLRKRGRLLTPAVIVGANAEGEAVAEQLRDWPTSGLYILGFIDENIAVGHPVINNHYVVGKLDDLETLVNEKQVEEIIIAPTALTREQLLGVFRAFTGKPDVNIRLSSGLFEILTTGLRVKELAYVPLIEVNKSRISGVDALLKWLMDYTISLIALIFLLPIFLIIGLIIRLDSRGPAIYRRRVMGLNGREFDAFKFRTMRVDGEKILEDRPELKAELERDFKIKDDPRVTRVGKFLRKFSIDELPQLFNVLLGQMSLIGPRMISPPEMTKYGKWGMNLLTVKPGITGLWQISGRSDVSYEERVRMDMYYIRNWTIWLDLYILLATFPAVLKRKGAY